MIYDHTCFTVYITDIRMYAVLTEYGVKRRGPPYHTTYIQYML